MKKNEMNSIFNTIYIFIIKEISLLHQRIFSEPMSENFFIFFKNLSFIGIGTAIGIVFYFIFNIMAGRILGPSGYGEFALLESIAQILKVTMVLGLSTTMVKFCAEDSSNEVNIISLTFFLLLFITFFSVCMLTFFSSKISDFFGVSTNFFYLSVIYAIFIAFFTYFSDALRGLLQFKKYSMIQPISAGIQLLIFTILISFSYISFKSILISILIAYGCIIIFIYSFYLREYIKLNFQFVSIRKIFKYTSYAAIGGIAFVIYTQVDKLMINYYLSIEQVGIYMSYYFSSISFLAIFSGSFVLIFFPTISKKSNKIDLFKKINKLIPFVVALIPLLLLSEFVILTLYGNKYVINFGYMILFAISAVLIALYDAYGWFFNSEGVSGIRITTSTTILVSILKICFNLILIPKLGIYGAMASTIIAFSIGILSIQYRGNYYFISESLG